MPTSATRRTGRAAVLLAIMIAGGTALAQQPERPQQPPSDPESEPDPLAERLIRKAQDETDEDVMALIMRLMDQAARQLEFDFDTGTETQQVQQKIMTELDEAIQIAAARRRPVRPKPPRTADKRKMQEPKSGEATQQNQTASADAEAAEPGSVVTPGETTDARTEAGRFEELRQGWGHLPMREREEIIQGIGEEFIERYREWIERYYRALQEADE